MAGDDTSPPTRPRHLAAAVKVSGHVRLTWTRSTDNRRVTGYQIVRDGRRIDTIGRRTWYVDDRTKLSRTYAYRVRARDAAGNWSPLSARVRASTPHPVVAAAGDIACDPQHPNFNEGQGTGTWCEQRATSSLLLDPRIDRVLPLGDTQYEHGRLRAFGRSYDPSWGRVKDITSPAVGNHEYRTSGAAGYFDYFGRAAGERDKGYYSYNLGRWHIVVLNTQCNRLPKGTGSSGCDEGSPQNTWLERDLDRHARSCTLAYWHQPPGFGSDQDTNNTRLLALWRDLFDADADLVLVGHYHIYARFAPLGRDGQPSVSGMRLFIVGSGGKNHGRLLGDRPGLQAQDGTSFGVLRLRLRPEGYDWRFVPAAGDTFTDEGSTACG